MSLKVIGKATNDMDKFRAFRKEERKRAEEQKCWPAALWKDYFYEHQDLCKFAETGYSNFYGGLNYQPDDRFDKKVEATEQYMGPMGLSWDLLFTNEVITVLRFGSLSFGIPTELVECAPYMDLDQYTTADLRHRIGLEKDGMHALVPAGDAGGATRRGLKEDIASVRSDLSQKEADLKELQEKQRQEIEDMKRMIAEKYKEQFDLIEQKKAEMELRMAQLEKQLFILDTELYAIRCFMGETVTFVPLRTGAHAQMDAPVILYQKLRFLDEELGKYLAIYGFDGHGIKLFEEALKHRDDLFDLFAPPDKSISLIRISRKKTQYGQNIAIANMLQEYETYHGGQIGILVRDGENLWAGWTDPDRINVKEDVFLKPQTEISAGDDTGQSSTKEEIASRYFIFSILQGILHQGNMLHLPSGCSVFKGSPYICFSMADGWLEDNRFGTFADIVERTDQPMQVGDMVLTTIYITRDDLYNGSFTRSTSMEPWYNNRGRGDKNRTHDADIPDKQILPVNFVEKEECYKILFKKYRCLVKEVPTDKEGVYTLQTERTEELIGHEEEAIALFDGYYDGRKKPAYDLRGLSEEQIYSWYMEYDQKCRGEYSERNYTFPSGKDSYYQVPCGIRKGATILHYYLSAEKQYSNARANMEIMAGEYLNLTYLNSIYVLYAIKNRKVGGWTVGGKRIDYANSIEYLNIALEFLRERERKEAEMLTKYMDLYPEWQVDLSEWRLEHQYHKLTDARAQKFAKYVREKEIRY